jgi:putative nucleic acid modification protein with dual OB domain
MPNSVWSRLNQVWKDRPRRRTMIVTDVTRMEGTRVCVGGYLEDGCAVRPIVGRVGPDEVWLQRAHGGPVAPFSVVSLHIAGRPKGIHAPHTEDRLTPARGQRLQRMLTGQERIEILERTCSDSVHTIFEADLHSEPSGGWGRYVLQGHGERSLGTVKAAEIQDVIYRRPLDRGRWEFRLRFRDAAGEVYQLAVVDLAFRKQLDQLRANGLAPEVAANAMLDGLHGQRVYLRVGLARGWEKHPDRCYLQLTGVYGFSVDGDH